MKSKKQWYKWTYLQNRNRLPDKGNKFIVTKGEIPRSLGLTDNTTIQQDPTGWYGELFQYLVLCSLCVSLSHVWLCATRWTVARQAPLSMGILQAKILERVAMPSSRDSQPRDWIQVFCIASGFFTIWATREALSCNTCNGKESEEESIQLKLTQHCKSTIYLNKKKPQHR